MIMTISCWFCIWDIGGNTVSFEYVSSNPKRSAIMWSSSSPSFTSTLLPTDTTTASAKSGLSASDKIALGTGIGIGLPSCLAGLVGCVVAIIAIRRRHSRKSKAGPSQDRIHLENMRPNQNSQATPTAQLNPIQQPVQNEQPHQNLASALPRASGAAGE
ncbi:hypothetical protein BKA61DRAFT_87856 [Leptodontidium sp. MPI-SDFR-AT-0119]|nr:hypothetical protein BKA61DRAFT_87856 [Leptodontidium sp. MPI-SDFR-AT-0119]